MQEALSSWSNNDCHYSCKRRQDCKTAGSFGVTATRPRMTLAAPIANMKFVADWAQLGFPEIFNESCLFPIVLTSTTSTGTVRGGGKISHG